MKPRFQLAAVGTFEECTVVPAACVPNERPAVLTTVTSPASATVTEAVASSDCAVAAAGVRPTAITAASATGARNMWGSMGKD